MPWTPLHIAIADESDLKVHEMAQDGTILRWLNETDEAGVTPLHLASETAQAAIVQARRCRSRLAACKIVTKIPQLLLSLGCDPSPRTTFNRATPMHLASEEGCVPIVNILAISGARPSLPASAPPPHPFARVRAGADVNAAALEGLTALHEAARYGLVVCSLGLGVWDYGLRFGAYGLGQFRLQRSVSGFSADRERSARIDASHAGL